jgi:cation diffusion facilitator family transporter
VNSGADQEVSRPGSETSQSGRGSAVGRYRRESVNRVLGWVLVANLVVVVAKLVAGLRSGSMAVLGIAADSGLDAFNNIVALLAIWVAAAPPDAEHPYGHSKFETLGAVAIVSFLSITCFEVARSAITRLITGAPPPHLEPTTFWVLGGTMVVNVAVAFTEQRMGRRLESEILQADSRHTGADVLITAAVLGGLALVAAGWRQGDAWLALVVAVLIGYSGYQILRDTVPILVDQRAVDPDRIRELVTADAAVRHASEIRSRGRPGEAFAELTIHVDPEAGVREAHEVADRVERLLEKEGGFSGVTVHVEPDRGDSGGRS